MIGQFHNSDVIILGSDSSKPPLISIYVAYVSVYFRVPDAVTTLTLLKRLTNFDKIIAM